MCDLNPIKNYLWRWILPGWKQMTWLLSFFLFSLEGKLWSSIEYENKICSVCLSLERNNPKLLVWCSSLLLYVCHDLIAVHSLAGSLCRCWPPSSCLHTARWRRRSERPDPPRALHAPRAARRGQRAEAEFEGRKRADWSVVKPFPLLDEDWSYAEWTALEETCSPEDPPHLEVTHG